jgi:hypothetical protein
VQGNEIGKREDRCKQHDAPCGPRGGLLVQWGHGQASSPSTCSSRMGIRPHLPLSGCSGLSASITSMGVRKGVVTATLAVATLWSRRRAAPRTPAPASTRATSLSRARARIARRPLIPAERSSSDVCVDALRVRQPHPGPTCINSRHHPQVTDVPSRCRWVRVESNTCSRRRSCWTRPP